MHAALDTAFAPVIFSHSSVRALTDHPRNVPDDVLTRLRGNGGVIQLTFVEPFISAAVLDWNRAAQAEWNRLGLQPLPEQPWQRAPRPSEDPIEAPDIEGEQDPMHAPAFRPWLAANPRPSTSAVEVADHVDHARDVAGVDHVGLGGDYDGTVEMPTGMVDVSGYPRLMAELSSRGWSSGDLDKLAGGNILRVLRETERAAQEPLWPLAPAR
jgi:membrane dipeptidase